MEKSLLFDNHCDVIKFLNSQLKIRKYSVVYVCNLMGHDSPGYFYRLINFKHRVRFITFNKYLYVMGYTCHYIINGVEINNISKLIGVLNTMIDDNKIDREEIAKKIGHNSHNYVRRLLKLMQNPQPYTLEKIAIAAGCTYHYKIIEIQKAKLYKAK